MKSNIDNKKNYPKIGFCVIQHPLEVGAEKSAQILEKVIKEFSNYDVDIISFNEIVDSDEKAAKAGNYFYENKVDVLLAVESTWSNDYHMVDILEYIDVPVALWAVPGMENGSLCSVHQLGVVLHELSRKYEIFYGDIGDKKIHSKILSYSKAVSLKKYLRKKKIGLIGYRVPGMTEVIFDELELKRKFGPRIIHFGINYIQEMADRVDEAEAKKIWSSIKNSGVKIEVSDEEGIVSCKNYLVLDKIAKENKISGFAVECYPDLMGQICLAASLLARDGIVVSCEGDVNSALAMMMLSYFTGEPVHNTDLLNPDTKNSVVFSHCGSGDFSIAKGKSDIRLCPVRLQNCGVCVVFLPKLGDITLVNIVGRKDTYRISAIEAYSQETKMVFPGNPVSARFDISVEKFLGVIAKNAIGHHWMIGYGKVLDEIKYFSDIVGVKFIDFS
jgi:L-fucose isomerase-like protein